MQTHVPQANQNPLLVGARPASSTTRATTVRTIDKSAHARDRRTDAAVGRPRAGEGAYVGGRWVRTVRTDADAAVGRQRADDGMTRVGGGYEPGRGDRGGDTLSVGETTGGRRALARPSPDPHTTLQSNADGHRLASTLRSPRSPREEGSSPSPTTAGFPTWRALPPPAWMPAGRRDECLDGFRPHYPAVLNLIES